MPDNRSAPSEHDLMQEITAPLATMPDDPVRLVADADFPVAMRGYDRNAVDAYVRRVTEVVSELAATRSPDAAVRRALERVGEEVSGILQRAHDTAERITAQARRDAESALIEAREQAAGLHAEGERRAKELDVETDRIWAERHQIVEDARQLANQLLALAESAAERFPAEEPPAGDAAPDAAAEDTTGATAAFPAPLASEGEQPGDMSIGPSGEYELEQPPEWDGPAQWEDEAGRAQSEGGGGAGESEGGPASGEPH